MSEDIQGATYESRQLSSDPETWICTIQFKHPSLPTTCRYTSDLCESKDVAESDCALYAFNYVSTLTAIKKSQSNNE